jgi:hypothetical protein
MAHESFKNLELDGKLFEDWYEKDATLCSRIMDKSIPTKELKNV